MMWGYNNFNGYYNGFGMMNNWFGLLIPFVVLDLILRGFALWKSAKREQNIWFIALLVVNSMGILPLIYLLLNREPQKVAKKIK